MSGHEDVRRRRWAVLVGVAVIAIGAGFLVWNARQDVAGPRRIVVPELSPVARQGQAAYDRHCVECHGSHGAGSADGPPLVHPVYRPAHHADVAFALAVQRGVRAHHWRFGDMPAQPDVLEDDIAAITRYVRELQVANDIE